MLYWPKADLGLKNFARGNVCFVPLVTSRKITQLWFDEEYACFRGNALKVLRFFCEMRSSESLEIYLNSKKTYRNIINEKKDAYK